MKYIVLIMSAFLLAACSGSHPVATAASRSPAATPSASASSALPSRSASASDAANAKVLIYALASGSSSEMSSAASAVSGPVMDVYVHREVLDDEAYAAAGQGAQAASVNQIPGGYQLCQSGTCVSFTAFHSDASGRITDFFADGGLVSHRLTVAADSTSSGLEITDVSALASIATGIMYVTFEARDISWKPVNTDPSFIPLFVASDGSRFEYDVSQSIMPSSLQPGQSAAVVIGFDTTVSNR